MAHFQGQTSPRAGKPLLLSIFICYSLSFLPSRSKRPIFNVKRALEQVNPLFCRFLCAIINGLFDDHELQYHYSLNISWTSSKTLAMEPVGPHGQNDPFSRLNKPRSGKPLFCQFSYAIVHGFFGDPNVRPPFYAKNFHGRPLRPFLWSQLAITTKTAHFEGQTNPGAVNPLFCQFSYAIVHGFFGDPKSQLAITTRTAHFKNQTTPEKVNPLFCQFSCSIVHRFFSNPKFRPKICQNFSWTSIKTLAMEQVDPHGQNGPF
ncbi:hypothetical protein H5410_054492 [Solanum commersonii]|uniref:Uncharacterized protein n=1 Tax=Solanum commersonii TaxID=4109 RepID=A0A9J5WHM9_SOLCO|nr:hypothetical protein H5410_054492 [Solanum commersonii]